VTKKDYCKFAEMISNHRKYAMDAIKLDTGYIVAWNDCAYGMADIFTAAIARFDKERFLKACGL
jgi:hypothetical protein